MWYSMLQVYTSSGVKKVPFLCLFLPILYYLHATPLQRRPYFWALQIHTFLFQFLFMFSPLSSPITPFSSLKIGCFPHLSFLKFQPKILTESCIKILPKSLVPTLSFKAIPMSSSTVCEELKQQQVKPRGLGSILLTSQMSHSTKPPCQWAQTTMSSGTSSELDSEIEQQFEKKHIKEDLYVHPLIKHSSSSKLSKKSLEMCTENLGCETGNSGTSSLSSSDSEETKFLARETSTKLRQVLRNTKANNSRAFPPPLTSISKANSVQYFRPHREGGRLVIKAVTVAPPSQTCFQAERVDGRLKLWFVSSVYSKVEDEEEEQEDAVGREQGHNLEEEDIGGNNGNDGGEMGIEKYHQRLFRCKEEGGNRNKRLLNFESFWVVT